MTKTVSLDELEINGKWLAAEVELYITTIDEDWEIVELTEWADEGETEIKMDVNSIDSKLEKEIIELAKAELTNSENWPTDRELKEDAYESHHNI